MKKKFFKLQTKLMFTVFLVTLFCISIISVFYYSENLKEKIMTDEIVSTNKTIVQSTVNDEVKNQENLVKDYAAWNDMYDNVQSKNIDWIKINTESFLQTYENDYFSIYNANLVCLYNIPNDKNLITLDLIKKLKGNYGYFFILDDSIPVHISWSIITLTSDNERKLQGVGYIFVAKNWDLKFISNLSKKTGFNIFIHGSSNQECSSIAINRDLTDIDGKSISDIHFEENNFIFQIQKQRKVIFIIVLICIIVVLFIFSLIIRRYITKPISIILKSLKTGNTSILERIRSDKVDDEWDLISDLVEDNINKTQKLKELVETKDKFFDLIAHDLRTPFNGIMGFATLLTEESEDYSEEEKKSFLKNIIKSSKSANKLLDRLLEWARLQTGRWNPDLQYFKINKVIDEVVSFHQANAIQREVHLIINFKGSFVVYADEHMIETAIRNLVSNAIKFTQKNGIIMIDIKKQEKDMLVTISDNGRGMDTKIIDSLFKIGEDVILRDASGNKGTGLGLILCKELIEKNGGTIWAESELEKGSKFHFTIPLNP